MSEETVKVMMICPFISNTTMLKRLIPAMQHGTPIIGKAPMEEIAPMVASASCAREQCPLWSSVILDDGGIKEGCAFKLMAERDKG